jgi:hypothetical protein
MKKKISLCHVCRSKIDNGKICEKCRKVAKEEAIQMRKNVEEALEKNDRGKDR